VAPSFDITAKFVPEIFSLHFLHFKYCEENILLKQIYALDISIHITSILYQEDYNIPLTFQFKERELRKIHV